jgi:hypothetical protein
VPAAEWQASLLRVIVGGGICPRFLADLFLAIRNAHHQPPAEIFVAMPYLDIGSGE